MQRDEKNYLQYDINAWETFAPVEAVKPRFAIRREKEELTLEMNGTGNEKIFGCWQTNISLDKKEWYEAEVTAKISQIGNPDLSLLAVAAGHFLEVSPLKGDTIQLKQIFFFEGDELYREKFSLFLRGTREGKVEWKNPVIKKITPPSKRVARIATVHFEEVQDKENVTLEMLRERIRTSLEEAGKVHPDLVLLTEFSPTMGINVQELEQYRKIYKAMGETNQCFYYHVAEQVPDGPTCQVLAKEAKKYGMYVVAGLAEKRGDKAFNTAVIFNRKGEFLGQYDKTHLTFGEMMQGISCGETYPVFELDFGKVAIHICYDEWFPEVSRYYAHAGAEILLLPVAGGKPITWRTRALDNNIYFVTAADLPPSMIIDSSGEILAETHIGGFVYADLDMDRRKVNYYGDRTLIYGMPGVVPQMRDVQDNHLLERLSGIYKGEDSID